MKDIYKPDEDCMAFSDETLEKYFFDKVKNPRQNCLGFINYISLKITSELL